MQHLAVAFETFQKQQLFANKKCLFGRAEIDYLGHIISGARVATDTGDEILACASINEGTWEFTWFDWLL